MLVPLVGEAVSERLPIWLAVVDVHASVPMTEVEYDAQLVPVQDIFPVGASAMTPVEVVTLAVQLAVIEQVLLAQTQLALVSEVA